MSKIIEIAKKEVGYVELPSNRTKYGQWFGLDGQPWCGIFVSWVYAQAGFALEKIGFSKGFAGCQTAVKHFTDTKQVTLSPTEGDIVFFDWNGDGKHDHTGIFVRWIDANNFESIEGNTSLSNQSNGGQVMIRKRKKSNVLFVHPKVVL